MLTFGVLSWNKVNSYICGNFSSDKESLFFSLSQVIWNTWNSCMDGTASKLLTWDDLSSGCLDQRLGIKINLQVLQGKLFRCFWLWYFHQPWLVHKLHLLCNFPKPKRLEEFLEKTFEPCCRKFFRNVLQQERRRSVLEG